MRAGCLQEVLDIVIWLGSFWYFGKLVAEERWFLTRGGHNRRFHCSYQVLCSLHVYSLSLIVQLYTTNSLQFNHKIENTFSQLGPKNYFLLLIGVHKWVRSEIKNLAAKFMYVNWLAIIKLSDILEVMANSRNSKWPLKQMCPK